VNDRDRAELQEIIRLGVIAGLQEHPCRFGNGEAAVLHEAGKRLDPDDIIAVAWLAKRLRGTADSAGRWFGRLVLAGLVGLTVLGAGVLLWGIRQGWLAPPTP